MCSSHPWHHQRHRVRNLQHPVIIQIFMKSSFQGNYRIFFQLNLNFHISDFVRKDHRKILQSLIYVTWQIPLPLLNTIVFLRKIYYVIILIVFVTLFWAIECVLSYGFLVCIITCLFIQFIWSIKIDKDSITLINKVYVAVHKMFQYLHQEENVLVQGEEKNKMSIFVT